MTKRELVEMVVNADLDGMTDDQLAEFCRATMSEEMAKEIKGYLDVGNRSDVLFYVGGAQRDMRGFMDPKEELCDSEEEAIEAAWNRWKYF